MPYSVSKSRFEQMVEGAIADLPVEFRRALKNVSIVVEDRPGPSLLDELDQDPGHELLGLYVGTPLPDRTYGDGPYEPDHILIFRRSIERMCRSGDEIYEQIKITLIHEIAHYFGFDEDYLQELGLG